MKRISSRSVDRKVIARISTLNCYSQDWTLPYDVWAFLPAHAEISFSIPPSQGFMVCLPVPSASHTRRRDSTLSFSSYIFFDNPRPLPSLAICLCRIDGNVSHKILHSILKIMIGLENSSNVPFFPKWSLINTMTALKVMWIKSNGYNFFETIVCQRRNGVARFIQTDLLNSLSAVNIQMKVVEI